MGGPGSVLLSRVTRKEDSVRRIVLSQVGDQFKLTSILQDDAAVNYFIKGFEKCIQNRFQEYMESFVIGPNPNSIL